jgi:hypothetical protein
MLSLVRVASGTRARRLPPIQSASIESVFPFSSTRWQRRSLRSTKLRYAVGEELPTIHPQSGSGTYSGMTILLLGWSSAALCPQTCLGKVKAAQTLLSELRLKTCNKKPLSPSDVCCICNMTML